MCGSLHGSSDSDRELAKYVKLEPQAQDKGFIKAERESEKGRENKWENKERSERA